MTRRCEASGAGMAASHPLPQSAGFASNVSRDVGVEGRNHRKPSFTPPFYPLDETTSHSTRLQKTAAKSLVNPGLPLQG